MRIIIAGSGEVGTHLAKLLSKEDQDIMVIDKNAERLAMLDANYNLMTHKGSPISFDGLKEAGAERCDLFIAVTPWETTNVTACSIAKSIGAKRTVARIDNYEYMRSVNRCFFSGIGVDELIYPEYLAALEIRTALERSWVRHWVELHDGRLIMVGVKINGCAQLVDMQLKELAKVHHHFHIAAIKRRHETIIPRGDDRICDGDIVYFITTKEHVDNIRRMCGKVDETIRRVMIMGGSRIAIRLAHLAGEDYRITIMDVDRDVCRRIADKCPHATVINGDARDIETLRSEGVADMDAFIALTDSSESNILSCLTAKEFGVKKTVAEVENIQLISEAENLNIGTIINKKLLASSKIFQLLIDADTENAKCLALADAEVAEIEVREGSRISKAPVKDLKISRDITLAGMVRDGKGMLITGATHLHPGDFVLVFSLSGAINKLEKLFK